MKKRNRRRNAFRSLCPRRAEFESLEQRCVLSATPTLAAIGDLTVYEGAPINLPLDAIYDLDGPLTYTFECSDPNVTVRIPEGNRSMKISVSAENGAITGDMIFELFEQRAPRVTNQIISLAESEFYDGLIFHRIIDGFMIQGGDPTGTGSGESYLGDFDDQFHLELMHTSSGVLSMAKIADDTNDCQFFITEGPARHLDFNHSVFGQLVEGENIREALSNVSTGANDRPSNTVTMESVEIFEDTENAILVINAPHDYSGSSNVTITVTIHDQYGNDYVQMPINVTIQEDTYEYGGTWYEENSTPFFSDLPAMWTPVNTEYTIDLSDYVQDAEGLDPFTTPAPGEQVDYTNRSLFLDAYGIDDNGEDVPYLQDPNLGYSIDFYTGIATLTPSNDIAGTYLFPVATGNSPSTLDMQVAALNIVPTEAPTSSLEMTFVTQPTAVDAQGEVDSLPTDAEWVHSWQYGSVEVWAKIDDVGEFGIYSVSTDLEFCPEQYRVRNIEWGVGFNQEQTGTIDNVNGKITGLGGTTKWYSVIPYAGGNDIYPPQGSEDVIRWGDDRYVLVARVNLEPAATSSLMKVQLGVGYNDSIPAAFSLSEGNVKWSEIHDTSVTVDTGVDSDIWRVPYDLDGSGVVDLRDLSRLISAYNVDIDAAGNQWGYACDFDRNGVVELYDLSQLISRFKYRVNPKTNLVLQDEYPPVSGGETAIAALSSSVASSSASSSVSPAPLIGSLTASDLDQHSDKDDDDEDDKISATDIILAFYGDYEPGL